MEKQYLIRLIYSKETAAYLIRTKQGKDYEFSYSIFKRQCYLSKEQLDRYIKWIQKQQRTAPKSQHSLLYGLKRIEIRREKRKETKWKEIKTIA